MLEEKLLWETKNQESIVIFSPKGRQALLMIGAAVFLILCGWSAFEAVLSLKSAWDIVLLFLWLLMAIGCALLVFTFLKLSFKPLLIINHEGIEDYSHVGKSPVTIRVKWEEIALISTTNERRAPGFQVALTANGQQTFLSRQNRWSRFFLSSTRPTLQSEARFHANPRIASFFTWKMELSTQGIPHSVIGFTGHLATNFSDELISSENCRLKQSLHQKPVMLERHEDG